MRFERIVYGLLVIASAIVAAINWRKAALFQADNDNLRAQLETLESEVSQSEQTTDALKNSAEKIRVQTSDLLKLRNEVTQLRTTATNAVALATDNQRLRAENQQLKHAGLANAGTAAASPGNFTGRDQIPRNSWTFAGYASPENALVSAIWAMREGDPKTYLASLAPDEQQRTSQNWQNKSEAELAEKHKSDVSTISGLRVLDRQSTTPNEMVMDIYLEGANRTEKVRMNQVGQDWKFGGFIRGQQPAAAAAAATPVAKQ